MKAWARHVLLHAKAKREGRFIHRHRWINVTSFMGTAYACTVCTKRISEKQLRSTNNTSELLEMFQPAAEWPALLPLGDGRGHVPTGRWVGR